MPKFPTQTSIQALEIYIKEIQRGNEVRVSSKTNRIYKANWVDKLILKIDQKFFDGTQASLWRAEAKMSIINKFSDECALVEPKMTITENSLLKTSLLSDWTNSEFDKKTVDDIKNKFLISVNANSKTHENIKKFWKTALIQMSIFSKKQLEKAMVLTLLLSCQKKPIH